jgi:hypothetical protein
MGSPVMNAQTKAAAGSQDHAPQQMASTSATPVRIASEDDQGASGVSPARQYQARLEAAFESGPSQTYSLRARMAIIGGGSLGLWAFIGGLIYLAVR